MEDKWPRGPFFQERHTYKNIPCWIWFVFVYAGLISGAFVAVTVLGVLHLQDLQKRCTTVSDPKTLDSGGSETLSQKTKEYFSNLERNEDYGEDTFKRYTVRDRYLAMRETVDLNVLSGRVVFYLPETTETSSGVAVVDYYEHLGGLYLSQGKERCYLVNGLDQHFPGIISLQMFLESGKVQESKIGSIALDYELSNCGDPITDLGLIPKELRRACRRKNTYWLKQVGPTDLGAEDTELTVVINAGQSTVFLTIREKN